MESNNKKRIFFLKTQLTAAVFLFLVLILSGFFIFGPELTQFAKALTGNYNKATGDSLDVTDWNNLDNDFVAKSGDTMTGALTLPGNPTTNLQAATKQYVDNLSIKDISGGQMKMYCGRTNPASWANYAPEPHTVYVDIAIPAGTFSAIPYYFSSLGGNAWHWNTYGATSIYDTTTTGFRVYVYNLINTMTSSEALSWGWHINWCAIGV